MRMHENDVSDPGLKTVYCKIQSSYRPQEIQCSYCTRTTYRLLHANTLSITSLVHQSSLRVIIFVCYILCICRYGQSFYMLYNFFSMTTSNLGILFFITWNERYCLSFTVVVFFCRSLYKIYFKEKSSLVLLTFSFQHVTHHTCFD